MKIEEQPAHKGVDLEQPAHKGVDLEQIPVGECFRYHNNSQIYMRIANHTLRGDIEIVLLETGIMSEERANLNVLPVDTLLYVQR